MGCWSQRKFPTLSSFEKLARRDCQHGAPPREAQEWFEVPGMQHFIVLAGNSNFGGKHPASLGRVPRTSSRVSVSRKDSTALFSADTWKTTFLFCSAHDPESDFISSVPTEKRIITEHDQWVETLTASMCTRSHDRADWSNPLFVDMDSGVGERHAVTW